MDSVNALAVVNIPFVGTADAISLLLSSGIGTVSVLILIGNRTCWP